MNYVGGESFVHEKFNYVQCVRGWMKHRIWGRLKENLIKKTKYRKLTTCTDVMSVEKFIKQNMFFIYGKISTYNKSIVDALH